jgi:uncharacterized protein DUF5317
MPGPGLVALMVAPVMASIALAVLCRGQLVRATPLRGAALVPVVVLASIAATRLQRATEIPDVVVNRALAGTILAACAAFLVLNRHQPSRLLRWGVLLAAGGAAGNALAMLTYGYMPVLAASAGLERGAHPDPQYVAAEPSQLVALLLGDVLPVRALDAVVSLGDLLLVPGCTILLASFVAPLLPSRGAHALAPPPRSLAPASEGRG